MQKNPEESSTSSAREALYAGWKSLGLGLMLVVVWAVAAVSARAQAMGADGSVGVRSAHALVPERGHEVALTHWYPASAGGVSERLGASAVFLGTPFQRDAPVVQGRFPLVVLSYGGLRAAPFMGGWLAASLVKRGYWVVQVHPPVLKPSDARLALREAWLRPADLSAAVSAALQDPDAAPHIAGSGVGVVGLMRGGSSALMLAGGRLDPARYARLCLCDSAGAKAGPDCAWFRQQQVAWDAGDGKDLGQSRLNARVKAVVAVAPEPGQAFSDDSLVRIGVPTHLVSLGEGSAVLPFLDASRLATGMPRATLQTLAQATVFSAFAPCTEQGPGLLKEEGDDAALCAEAGGHSRRDVHARLASLIVAALRPSLAFKSDGSPAGFR